MGENKHGRFHISRRHAEGSAPAHLSPAPAASRRPRIVTRIMHGWWRISRGMTLGVRAVVLDRQGGVLLLRHTYAPGWQFPGGGVEPGETIAEALARELEEEAAVRLLEAPALHGLFFNSFVSRRDHVAVYVVRRYSAGTPRVPNREIAEVRFWPLDALPPDISPGTRRRLHEITGGLPPAPRW